MESTHITQKFSQKFYYTPRKNKVLGLNSHEEIKTICTRHNIEYLEVDGSFKGVLYDAGKIKEHIKIFDKYLKFGKHNSLGFNCGANGFSAFDFENLKVKKGFDLPYLFNQLDTSTFPNYTKESRNKGHHIYFRSELSTKNGYKIIESPTDKNKKVTAVEILSGSGDVAIELNACDTFIQQISTLPTIADLNPIKALINDITTVYTIHDEYTIKEKPSTSIEGVEFDGKFDSEIIKKYITCFDGGLKSNFLKAYNTYINTDFNYSGGRDVAMFGNFSKLVRGIAISINDYDDYKLFISSVLFANETVTGNQKYSQKRRGTLKRFLVWGKQALDATNEGKPKKEKRNSTSRKVGYHEIKAIRYSNENEKREQTTSFFQQIANRIDHGDLAIPAHQGTLILQAPTGSGKTYNSCCVGGMLDIVVSSGGRGAISVPTIALSAQVSEQYGLIPVNSKVDKVDTDVAEFDVKAKFNKMLYSTSYDKLSKLDGLDFLINDEFHNCIAERGYRAGMIKGLSAGLQDASKVLHITGTLPLPAYILAELGFTIIKLHYPQEEEKKQEIKMYKVFGDSKTQYRKKILDHVTSQSKVNDLTVVLFNQIGSNSSGAGLLKFQQDFEAQTGFKSMVLHRQDDSGEMESKFEIINGCTIPDDIKLILTTSGIRDGVSLKHPDKKVCLISAITDFEKLPYYANHVQFLNRERESKHITREIIMPYDLRVHKLQNITTQRNEKLCNYSLEELSFLLDTPKSKLKDKYGSLFSDELFAQGEKNPKKKLFKITRHLAKTELKNDNDLLQLLNDYHSLELKRDALNMAIKRDATIESSEINEIKDSLFFDAIEDLWSIDVLDFSYRVLQEYLKSNKYNLAREICANDERFYIKFEKWNLKESEKVDVVKVSELLEKLDNSSKNIDLQRFIDVLSLYDANNKFLIENSSKKVYRDLEHSTDFENELKTLLDGSKKLAKELVSRLVILDGLQLMAGKELNSNIFIKKSEFKDFRMKERARIINTYLFNDRKYKYVTDFMKYAKSRKKLTSSDVNNYIDSIIGISTINGGKTEKVKFMLSFFDGIKKERSKKGRFFNFENAELAKTERKIESLESKIKPPVKDVDFSKDKKTPYDNELRALKAIDVNNVRGSNVLALDGIDFQNKELFELAKSQGINMIKLYSELKATGLIDLIA